MEEKSRGAAKRLIRGLGVLADRGLGRTSLAVSAAASFLYARSPGAALVFILLPSYLVLSRGNFSEATDSGPSGPGFPRGQAAKPGVGSNPGQDPEEVRPAEIPVRLAAAVLAAAAGIAALGIGSTIAQRFRAAAFSLPWGLGAACMAASLVLAAVHLPFLAAGGRRAGRIAAGAVFAAAGIAAALSSFPVGSLYAAFLRLLYSGGVPGLYLPLVSGAAALAGLSAAGSWAIARARTAGL